MDSQAIIKRITLIGAELVSLQRKREEIDKQTTMLIREAHRLTRPHSASGVYDGEPDPADADAPVITANGPKLVRNGEPTTSSRMLRYLAGTDHAVTKYEPAQALGLTPVQVHYCLVGLKKQGLVAQPAKGMWALTERGKAASGKAPPALRPAITVEADTSPGSPSDTR